MPKLFEPGNKGGPGRPKRRTEEQYLKATVSAVTLADWKAIVAKARDQAMRGDSRARKWLSDYLIGVPQQHVDVTSKGERITGYVAISPDDWDKDNAGE